MTDEKITRINELYHKAKTEGLTFEERQEQSVLRAEFIASFKKNLRTQLDNIDVQNPDGTIENLGEKHEKMKSEMNQ
ncbi:MAG: DUF896 domain-containing protein [Lachnospiraceae bacterium]|nr:DUF896 domain-containing protein [Lachnospiraceae bacterium]